jgi:hypothetical protein
MAESGVLYTFPDDLLEEVPSLIQSAGMAFDELSPPAFGEGCERSFALRISRDKAAVELTGFCFLEEGRFVVGVRGGSRNPLRWFHDQKLAEEIKNLLTDRGMKRLQ